MTEGISIKENGDLLKKIVAEKGFSGYKNRYYLILQEIIKKDTVYEELSDESKAILHQETGLDEEKIKVMSELVYGKQVPDADAEEKPLQTKIGFILSLLPYRKNYSYRPLPEEKRPNPLEEYIALLSLSLDMLRLPLEILDTIDGNAYGCLDILDAVLRIHPRYHLFGHVHGAYGVFESSPTTYINGSILNENYERTNQPVLIDMNEILIVPDVHGRRFWEPALDYPGQIIFLGDYFDPYPGEGIGETEALETFLRIISFKQKNPDRVTLLIGNHELHYYPESGKYSRFSPHCHVVINEMLTNDETKGLFQVCKQVGNYLFIHGGVTKRWYDKHYEAFAGLGDTLEERLNRYFIENMAAFEEVSPNYRAGENEVSSPLWADIRELDAEGNDHFDNDIIQIVGHTQTDDEKILVINNVGAADNQKLHIFWNGEFDLYQ